MTDAETGDAENHIAQEIYQLISRSFMRLDASDHLLVRRFGLTLTQSWALVHLGNEDGRSLSELARLLICDKSNVTSIIDKLEEEGLVVRKRGKQGDRRYTQAVLTEQGHALRKAIMAARERMVQERFRTLSKNDLEQLHSSLQRLADLLTTQLENNEEDQIIDRAFEQNQVTSLVSET